MLSRAGVLTLLWVILSMSAGCRLAIAQEEAASNASSPSVDVFYVTDRAPVTTEAGGLSYGSERSRSVAFGSVSVWGENAANSRISAPNELGRFPEVPYRLENVKGAFKRRADVSAEHARTSAIMKKELAERVRIANRHEAVIFIHGYHNSFEDALDSTAQICNDIGPKDFVCIAITWPAGGSKGALLGYNVDRESGEFAVGDVRKALRAIGTTPGLNKLHIIAHSRGADVLSSAFQQLAIESYASQTAFIERLKIHKVILAAPDLDLDVAFARLLSVVSDPEMQYGKQQNYKAIVSTGKMHFTVYASQGDMALKTSRALFGSDMRLGLMDANIAEKLRDLALQSSGATEFVSVEDGGGFIGHSYFLSSPDVRTDIAEVIKNDKKPGDEGRPLVEVQSPFWILPHRAQ